MTELLTAAQMRAIEQAAIASGEVTGLELMERAGRGVVEAIFEEWPELAQSSHRAVVLCGPGNNGGDGFVVARLLKEWGWEVEVFLYGDPDKLPLDAKVNYERWLGMGEVRSHKELTHEEFVDVSISIDALFGTGLTRRLDRQAQSCLSLMTEVLSSRMPGKPPIVAVDIASGFDADSGHCFEQYEDSFPCYYPSLTVTFERPKLGHYLASCALRSSDQFDNTGKLSVKSLGIGEFVRELSTDRETVLLLTTPVGWFTNQLPKYVADHKYGHGHALILSGGPGKGGAARLAARGALRIGAGLVTVGCPPEALAENAARLDAVMLRPVAGAGVVDGLGVVLEDERINALCLGPGLGLDRAGTLVPTALASGRACVLDADALMAFADDPCALFAMLHDKCVLTPHAGEFARLFPDIAEKLATPATTGPAYSKVDACREAAKRAGCVVLFKGPDTVIADPEGRCSINSAHYDRAAPWLATAGSGDVLAGFVTGLLARGFSPMAAAETGAWLHVECARTFGPGLIAEDLPEQLPSVFRSLGL